jgi:hypothetical protein
MPYTIEAPAQDAPPPIAKGKYTIGPPEDGPGVLTRMWNGLLGRDASGAGSVGMGMADPFYGQAQLGAHTPISAGMPEVTGIDPQETAIPKETTETVDKAVREREARYTEGRRQATPGINDPEVGMTPPDLGTDWYRLLGNVASPVNLATAAATPAGGAVSKGLPLAQRFATGAGLGAGAGALGGASQPVTGPNFASEKAKQIGAGGLGGAVVGPAASEVGGLAQRGVAALKGVLGRTPEAAQAAAGPQIQQRFNQSIPPSTRGIGSEANIADQQANRLEAVKTIAENQQGLKVGPNVGWDWNRLPKTRMEMARAVSQVKDRLFQKWDPMVGEAEQAGGRVELQPLVADLQNFADQESTQLSGNKSIENYLKDRIGTYTEMGAASPRAVQDAIKNFNRSLESFYKNPSYETTAHASIDAMIANRLRKGLDEVVTNYVGPGYQALKNQYGALSSIEGDVAKSAIKSLGNTPQAASLEHLMSVSTTEEVMRGLATMRIDPIARGVMFGAARAMNRLYSNPDRQIRLMFQQAQRAFGATPETMSRRGGLAPTAAGSAAAAGPGTLQYGGPPSRDVPAREPTWAQRQRRQRAASDIDREKQAMRYEVANPPPGIGP